MMQLHLMRCKKRRRKAADEAKAERELAKSALVGKYHGTRKLPRPPGEHTTAEYHKLSHISSDSVKLKQALKAKDDAIKEMAKNGASESDMAQSMEAPASLFYEILPMEQNRFDKECDPWHAMTGTKRERKPDEY
jgi:hypothetical protein